MRLDSPRMKFAIKHAGVSLPEIYPQVSSPILCVCARARARVCVALGVV